METVKDRFKWLKEHQIVLKEGIFTHKGVDIIPEVNIIRYNSLQWTVFKLGILDYIHEVSKQQMIKDLQMYCPNICQSLAI